MNTKTNEPAKLPSLLKFRPQEFNKNRNWRFFRQKGYNWQIRRPTITDPLARIFSRIHYLTAHSPKKVSVQWQNANQLWHKRMKWHKAGINERL
jgi:hypothetical protein